MEPFSSLYQKILAIVFGSFGLAWEVVEFNILHTHSQT